ncbi:hypothetical protein TRFO_32803 [Tritrichomonas foetus]|uniref:Sugar phosphate transporter domain-containing protein n=1 Tax=Tritrichomonas foetus TaxID=1144522 RepID=A0A1J4JPZ2_9EUKA|nr:hypothetical protein TRFO_32803 [Tritrichomonas foetus]|eukprot:OHT00488.1 hypothetical protein TRFO_32803 [Tritrichomonas foetus]
MIRSKIGISILDITKFYLQNFKININHNRFPSDKNMLSNFPLCKTSKPLSVASLSIIYGSLSILLVFFNRYLLGAKNMPVNQIITVQCFISAVCLGFLRIFIKFPITLPFNDFVVCLGLNFSFVIMLIGNSFALKFLSIHMVTLLKCCNVVVTAILERIIMKNMMSVMMWISLLLIVVGSVFGIKSDLVLNQEPGSFNLFSSAGKGYVWMFVSIVAMSIYAILSKYLITKRNVHFFTASFWNNTMCVILLPCFIQLACFCSSNYCHSNYFRLWKTDDMSLTTILVVSGLISLLLNISIYSLLGLTTATSYIVVSAAKKFVQAFISLWIFQTSPSNFISVIIGLCGATLYAFLKWKEIERIRIEKENEDNECLLSSDSSERSQNSHQDLFPMDPID